MKSSESPEPDGDRLLADLKGLEIIRDTLALGLIPECWGLGSGTVFDEGEDESWRNQADGFYR